MMETYYQGIIWTKHAISRLYNRGISQSDAWHAFTHADGSVPGKTIGSRNFYKDYGRQRIEIIAKKNDKGEWVILSCWSRYPGKATSTGETFLSRLIRLARKIGQNPR